MIAHTTLAVSDYTKSKAFYTTVLATLGYSQNMEYGKSAGFNDGKNTDFWISAEKSVVPTHLAFQAGDRKQVEAFHKARTMALRVTATTPRDTSRRSLSTQTAITLRLFGTIPPGSRNRIVSRQSR
jgi:catechol 2,3-dioxygenase-like lactoylglutathione lyase family enzyme